MTRKHFNDLANRLASMRPDKPNGPMPWREWDVMVEEMANFCRSYNPNFKRDKFIEACRTR